MTRPEARFIEHWKEQRSGSKAGYYLQFTIGWTVVSFLVIFFLLRLFTNLWVTGGKYLVIIIALLAIIIGFISTHLTYSLNEKKYNKIIEKENKP